MMGLHEYTRFSVNDDGSLEYLGKFGDEGLDIIYNAGKFVMHTIWCLSWDVLK